MSENMNAEQITDEQTGENLIHELSVSVADNAKEYMADKEAAREAKEARDQDIARRYFEEAEEPNVEELAEVFGKSVAFATATAKAAGVELGTGKRGRPSKFTEDEQKAIAQDFANAKDTFKPLELALQHRVSPETIKGWAVKYGFVTVKKRDKVSA